MTVMIRSLWSWLLSRLGLQQQRFTTMYVEDLPESLDRSTLYVVGESGHNWYAAMVCPCGCEATLHMSLLANSRPRWYLVEHANGTVSLEPSVWRQTGCRSHFFLRYSLIVWC